MVTNKIKRKLQNGEMVIGAACGMGTPRSAEIMASVGYDFVLIDNQHGTWDRGSSSAAFAGILAGGATPVARAPENDYYAIGPLLDEGALGIVIPMVETRADAERAVYACRFPPAGGRSSGGVARWYGPDYEPKVNDELVIAIQLESGRAIENAEAIMSVDGVDACWLGPSDLANSIGHARNTPQHDAAVMKMVAACKKYGKAAGLAAGTPEYANKWIAAGCTFVTLGGDSGYVRNGARADLEAVKRP